MGEIEPRLFKGTRDFLPDMMSRKQYMTDKLRVIFERYGFEPVETPAMEFYDILVGKYGGESEKLIYPLAYRDGKTLALRYDLTVPLARLVAMHPELPLPFKRYQMQPVWRADNPQLRQGRFREFVQCDVDTVGAASVLADAEIMGMIDTCLMELGIRRFLLKVSHRQILPALVDLLLADATPSRVAELIRIMDKHDKVGTEGVRRELGTAGLIEKAIDFMIEIINIKGTSAERFEAITKLIDQYAQKHGRTARLAQILARLNEAIDQLRIIYDALRNQGIDESHYEFYPALARDLAYYTGPIFEAVLPDQPHIGSLCGGGRYDKLIGRYAGREVPATGTTIGLDRIIAAMEQLDLLPASGTKVDALVCLFDEASAGATQRAAAALRKAGLNVDTYFEPEKLKKQFSYADKRGIPAVVVIGPDEYEANKATVKNMKTGEQKLVAFDDMAQTVRQLTRQ